MLDAGADAGVPDGSADSGSLLDAGVADSGTADDSGVADAGGPSCATVRCSPWSACFEDAGAACLPIVTALRLVIPAADASVPLDTVRLSVAVEVTGEGDSVPVSASGAGQARTIATRSDGGLAVGQLSFVALNSGAMLLTAGWSGGPDASTIVRVLAQPAIQILGANPPSYGVNTTEFEPNDPEGPAWRRDDRVPVRVWPNARIAARHLRPDASIALLSPGALGDGGAYFPLRDVEFNAFRDPVEFRAVGDAWESAPQQLTVTRWRWRRVVAGVPNPFKIQQPTIARVAPGTLNPLRIVVGTEDTATTGRLVALDQWGVPSSPTVLPPNWTDAVTAPIDGCHVIAAGFNADGGYLWSGQSLYFGGFVQGDRYERFQGADGVSVGITQRSIVVEVVDFRSDSLSVDHPAEVIGSCEFDAGAAEMAANRQRTFVRGRTGELCRVQLERGYPVGTTRLPGRSASMTTHAFPWVSYDDGRLTYFSSNPTSPTYDAGAAEYLSSIGYGEVLLFRGTSIALFDGATIAEFPTGVPLATHPLVASDGPRSQPVLHLVDRTGRLRVLSGPSLTEQWSWRPDSGVRDEPGFAPPRFDAPHFGAILVPVMDSVVGVITDATVARGILGGDPANCAGDALWLEL